MKIYNIHRLAVPADRRPVWAGDAFTPARASFNGDAGWWNGQRHNMAVPVWSVTEILSLSLSLLFMHICAWQSADGHVTSDHCRVTVQWLFFKKISKSLETSKKRCLTVGRRSRDLRPMSRDRSVTFFKNFPNCLKRPKNVVWQSADGRVTSDHCRVTVQWLFQKISKSLETSKKRCLRVGRRSRDLRPLSRDRSVTFFKKFPNCLKRLKNVVWQSADGRVTTDHCHVTVQWLFSKFLLIAWNVQKTLFDSRLTVAWPPTTVAWPFSDFFKKFPDCLKRLKNVVWQSADGSVTTDHCHVTVQWLFSNFFLIAWNVQKTLFESRPTVAWPLITVAWPFSDFFQKIYWLLETSKKRCLTVGRRSHNLQPLSRDRWATFFKNFLNCLKRRKKLCLKASGRSRDCPATLLSLLPYFLRTASHTLAYVSFSLFSSLLKKRKKSKICRSHYPMTSY